MKTCLVICVDLYRCVWSRLFFHPSSSSSSSYPQAGLELFFPLITTYFALLWWLCISVFVYVCVCVHISDSLFAHIYSGRHLRQINASSHEPKWLCAVLYSLLLDEFIPGNRRVQLQNQTSDWFPQSLWSWCPQEEAAQLAVCLSPKLSCQNLCDTVAGREREKKTVRES